MTDESKKQKPEPKGVIAIMTSPRGDVIATAPDFHRDGYGGFKLWEAQRIRAQKAVKLATVRAYCSPIVMDAISSYDAEQIAEALCRKGHQITYRAVGWPDDVAAEIAR